MIQLEMFEKETTTLLKDEIAKLKISNDKMRKALFARHGELAKNYLDLLHRLEIIERHICRGGLNEQVDRDSGVANRATKEIALPAYPFENPDSYGPKDMEPMLRKVCG